MILFLLLVVQDVIDAWSDRRDCCRLLGECYQYGLGSPVVDAQELCVLNGHVIPVADTTVKGSKVSSP